jgi:hypothetical protein
MTNPPSMFESIGPDPGAIPDTIQDYIQPTFNDGLRIWWAFFWPATLVSSVLVFLAMAWLKYLYENSYVPGSMLRYVRTAAPYLISYAVAFFVMYYILHKNFRNFHIGLLSNHGGDDALPLKPTFRRTLPVWFTYSWRTLVYRLIAGFVASIPIGVILGIFTRMAVVQLALNVAISTALDGAVGLFVIYNNILEEDFADFRVRLLPRKAPSPAERIVLPVQPLPPQPPVLT